MTKKNTDKTEMTKKNTKKKRQKMTKNVFEQSPGYGCEFLLTPIAVFTPLRRYAVMPIAVFTLVSGCIGASARKTFSGPQSPSYEDNYEVSICRAHGKRGSRASIAWRIQKKQDETHEPECSRAC